MKEFLNILNVLHNSEFLAKILFCVILTGIIGYNREKNGMTVGIRTHILVGLSAILLQEISLNSVQGGDPMRLGGQMLTGIGFLGAGAILKDKKSIKGITTAASIFFVACIGLSIGASLYYEATVITLIAYIFLIDLFKLKDRITRKKLGNLKIEIEITGTYSEHTKEIVKELNILGIEVASFENVLYENNLSTVILTLNVGDETSDNDIISGLSHLEFIRKINTVIL